MAQETVCFVTAGGVQSDQTGFFIKPLLELFNDPLWQKFWMKSEATFMGPFCEVPWDDCPF